MSDEKRIFLMNQVGLFNNNYPNHSKETKNFGNINPQNDATVLNNEIFVNWNKKKEKYSKDQINLIRKKEEQNSSHEFVENEKIIEKPSHLFVSNFSSTTDLPDNLKRNLDIPSDSIGLSQNSSSRQFNNSIYDKNIV